MLSLSFDTDLREHASRNVRCSWHSVKVKLVLFRGRWECVSLADLRVTEIFPPLLRPKRGRHAKLEINDACAPPLFTASNQFHHDNKQIEHREKNSPLKLHNNNNKNKTYLTQSYTTVQKFEICIFLVF